MAVSIKHTTQAVGTDAGNGEIRKAQWNEEHTLTAAADTLLGAVTTGAVTEITCTAAGRALLDDADASAQRTTLAAAGTGVTNTFSANQIISVTDNTNAALRVTQLGTAEAIRVEDSTNPDSTPFVVTADGSVGVGTSSPNKKLSVLNAGSTQFTVDTTAGANDIIKFDTYNASAVAGIYTWSQQGTERMRISSSGNVLVTSTGGLGYGTGSGGAVTQATSRTTGVTLNKTNGAITLVSAAGSATWQSFTVTNSTVAATDTVIVSQKSGTDLYQAFVTNVAAGSFGISFATTGGTTTEQPVFNFSVIKAVTS